MLKYDIQYDPIGQGIWDALFYKKLIKQVLEWVLDRSVTLRKL